MSKTFLKIFFGMSFFLILGKLLGFVRTAMVASSYGAGFVTDLYSFEDSLINELYAIFSTFLACSFIPRYLSLDDNGRNRLFNLLLNWGCVIMLAITALCFIFTKPLLYLLVPGYFKIYDVTQIIRITRINLIMLIITFLVNYFLVVLQAHEVFSYLTLESVVLNVIIIGYLLTIPEYGIVGLVMCRIIAYLILLAMVVLKVKKSTPLTYRFFITARDKDLQDMIKLSLPMLGITVLWQVNYIIDKSMASGLASGSVACLNYANTISMIIYNIIGYIVTSYAYPTLSKIQSNEGQFKASVNNYLKILLKLVLPVSILTMFFAHYASDLLYGHGNMSEESIDIIARILVVYLPGSVAYCIKNMYSKVFYIRQNTRIVLLIDVMGCGINIALNLILVEFWGVYGLALATSISYFLTVVLQAILANKKKYTNLKLKDLKTNFVLMVFLILVGYGTSLLFGKFTHSAAQKFVFVAAVYIIAYFLSCYKDLKLLLQSEKGAV